MRLKYEYTTRVDFRPAVGRHNLLLRCQPAREAFQQVCNEEFLITPGFWHCQGQDALGNRIISAGTDYVHDTVLYSCRGTVQQTTYCIPDAAPHPMYTLPSRLTSCNKEMQAAMLPATDGDRLEVCLGLCHMIHQYIVYTTGVTGILTTAQDVFTHRRGVCQDYAHLMIALCRRAGIPARYVCGLMRGEGQTHAWVEAHDGLCWYAFDPTNDTAVATGYIKLAHGRDALDCSVSRGTYMGVTRQTTTVNVNVMEI